jgi:hypothetical protein
VQRQRFYGLLPVQNRLKEVRNAMGSFEDPAFGLGMPEPKDRIPVSAEYILPDLGLRCSFCLKERSPQELGVVNRKSWWNNQQEQSLGCKSCFPDLDTSLSASSPEDLVRIGGKSLLDEVLIAVS